MKSKKSENKKNLNFPNKFLSKEEINSKLKELKDIYFKFDSKKILKPKSY